MAMRWEIEGQWEIIFLEQREVFEFIHGFIQILVPPPFPNCHAN
jgi:hypothetical protein